MEDLSKEPIRHRELHPKACERQRDGSETPRRRRQGFGRCSLLSRLGLCFAAEKLMLAAGAVKATRFLPMYLEYFARLPDAHRLRNCRNARALLARLHAQAEPTSRFDLRLLHLEADGRPRHAPTAIRIGSRARSLMISAVGRTAVECVLGEAPKVGALVARHYGIDSEQSYRQGDCELRTSTTLCTYDVPSLVLCRRNFERERGGASMRQILSGGRLDHPHLLHWVQSAVTSGIERQAGICLLDVPAWLMGDIVVHRLAPVQVKPGVFFVVGAVSFRAALRLGGPWYAGHLQGRGYGRIFPSRPPATTKAPR